MGPDNVAAVRRPVTKQFVWVWDESDQKVRRFRSRTALQKSGAGVASAHIMVQSGEMFKLWLEDGRLKKEHDAICVRRRRLEYTTTNFMAEVMLRGFLFDGGMLECFCCLMTTLLDTSS